MLLVAQFKERIAELEAELRAAERRVDELKETADGYRIEADCAMRDFDRLEVAASEALEILSVKNRYPDWHRAAEILRSELERDSTEGKRQ